MYIGNIRPDATAYIRGGKDATDLWGVVSFFQKKGGVLVTADINGLPQKNGAGFFGFHIHEGTSCGGTDFSETKNHYNPENKEHPMHAGDLPPLLSNAGMALMSFFTDRFSVKEILGRTVVIHDMPDDFYTQPSGNSGTKIGCGVIDAI